MGLKELDAELLRVRDNVKQLYGYTADLMSLKRFLWALVGILLPIFLFIMTEFSDISKKVNKIEVVQNDNSKFIQELKDGKYVDYDRYKTVDEKLKERRN